MFHYKIHKGENLREYTVCYIVVTEEKYLNVVKEAHNCQDFILDS